MIVDKKQFDKFVEILPDLHKGEMYFISLSARNKYLTDEERIKFKLNRTEMFSRTLVKSKEDFEYAMKKMYSVIEYKTTKSGEKFPPHALVAYANVNPVSTIDAYFSFKKKMDLEFEQIYKACLNNSDRNYDGFIRIERHLQNCLQQSRSRKYFIDLDFDRLENVSNEAEERFFKKLSERNVTYYTINTHGGIHVLLRKDSLTKEFKLHEEVKKLQDSNFYKEVDFNKNDMVPIPGTIQAGFEVIINE